MKFRIVIQFNEEWILSKRNDDILPVELMLSYLNSEYSVTNEKSDISSINCNVNTELSSDEFKRALSEFLSAKYDIKDISDMISIEVEEATETNNTNEVAIKSPKDEDEILQEVSNKNEKSEKESIMKRVNVLVGASDFKALCEECVRVAERLKSRNVIDSFVTRSYIVAINEGCGFSTYLNIFADLIDELDLFKFTSKNRISEVKLGAPESNGNNSPFSSALSYIQSKNGGKVIGIDISEWMAKIHSREFRNFLRTIYENRGNNIIFFRIPFVENTVLQDINAGINDLLFVKSLSIVPFNNSELLECAKNIVSDKGFDLERDAWDIFNARVIEEKNDGRFYGINTIEKIVHEMIYLKILYGEDSDMISKSDISMLIDADSFISKSGQEMLDELIGMDLVRERVIEIVAQIEAASKNSNLEQPCIHMRFVGNPGTGKTTVARIIGKLLKEKGILRNGDFFEHSGRDLCGRFVGETAPKTSSICRDAYGSVLFIDEAYSLYRSEGISHADYGKEAIDTLIAEMENHRDDFIVIMAGYPDEMENLMKSNAGLKSRMPYQIEFPNYTREQLAEMFISMVNKHFQADDKLCESVNNYFQHLSDEVMQSKEFSNARYVRNLYERTWGKAVLHCQMTNETTIQITADDFRRASSETEFKNLSVKKNKPIGFI